MNKDRKKELDTLLNTNLEEEKDGKEKGAEILPKIYLRCGRIMI